MEKDQVQFQLDSTFFGLTSKNIPEFRISVFKQIHEIVFHGQGGYDWETVYNMPIWLRKYTFKEISDYYTEQNKKIESAGKSNKQQTLMDSLGNIKNKAIIPKTGYK